jgi:hypothetical protein
LSGGDSDTRGVYHTASGTSTGLELRRFYGGIKVNGKFLIAMANGEVPSLFKLGFTSTNNTISPNVDVVIERDAANTLAQRNGTAQQESRIYGTYSGAGADYRRLALKMSTAGVAQIVAEGAGTGAADNRLEFVTGGATRMTVAADGNITTSGSITGTGALTLAAGGTAQDVNIAPSTTGKLLVTNSTTSGKTASFVNNAAGTFIGVFEANAPNITTGQAAFFAVGRNPATNNQFSFGFEYVANGSPSNKFNINAFGSAALFSVLASGNVGIGTTSPSALLDVNSNTVRVRTARTPASATAAGNAGDICWDADYIYVCTATNTWKRTAISTWP